MSHDSDDTRSQQSIDGGAQEGGVAAQNAGQPNGNQQPPGTVSEGAVHQQPVQQAPSLTDKLQSPEMLDRLKVIVAVYAAVGAGIGISGYVFFGQLFGGSESGGFGAAILGGIAALALLVSTVVVGIGLAGVLSLYFADLFPSDLKTNAVGAGLGSYVGFLLMTVIAIVFVGMQISSGGDSSGGISLDVGKQIVPLILSGIPAGLVGAAVVYIKDAFGSRNA